MVTFPPLHHPNSPGLAERPPPPPPIPGPGQARGAGVAATASTRFLSAGAGGPGREVKIGSGARASPGAEARQRGRRQGRQNRRPSERGRQESQLRAALRVSKAGDAASPAADEDKAPDPRPLRPQPRVPLRSVTRTARAGSGFHWWPGLPRLRPPPAAAPPLSARATAVREPPAGAGAVRGELGSGRLWSRRRQLALHCCPGDPERRRYGTQTTSCESQEAPRPGALIL